MSPFRVEILAPRGWGADGMCEQLESYTVRALTTTEPKKVCCTVEDVVYRLLRILKDLVHKIKKMIRGIPEHLETSEV